MNLDLIHYASPPVVGGVESVMNHHARLFLENGQNVRIIAGRGDQIDPRIIFIHYPLIDSRDEEILRIKSYLDEGEIPENFFLVVDKIYSNLFDILDNTDILIAHNVCSLAKNLPLTAAIQRLTREKEDIRYILWHHDLAWATPRYASELHDGFPWDLLRSSWPGVTNVAVSRERQRELAELYGIEPGEIYVIPNGLDAGRFLKLENETTKYIDQLNLFDAEPLLLLPVRITTRKNIEFALDVVKCLLSYYPKTVLLVTGPLGPHNPANIHYFNKLINLRDEKDLSNSVFFLAEYTDEYIPDEVISDLYQISDALLLPSKEEGFGIPILEAGMVGIPIFCSDIPALRELGGKHVCYFSVDSSPSNVASMIDSRLSLNLSFKMRVQVRQNYIWEYIYRNKIAPLIGD